MDDIPNSNLSHSDFPEYTASLWVWKICSPILIAIGTFGNVLSIVVLSRKSMRHSSLFVYLIILCVSDLMVLYTGLLRQWIIVIADIDVRDFNVIICKFHIVLVYVSLQYSAWILVIVTMERCVCIWFPYRRNLLCTRKGRLVAAITTLFTLVLLDGHFFYGYVERTDINNTTLTCTQINAAYKDFIENIWPWIDLCTFCLLPFCILIVGNLAIILKTLRTKNEIRRLTIRSNGCVKNTKIKDEQTSSVTRTLLVLNLVFFITTSPISVYLIGENSWLTEDPHVIAKDLLAWACVNILQYSNNAMNFFMYCLSGSRFRRELLLIFKSLNPKQINGVHSFRNRREKINDEIHENSLSSISRATVADNSVYEGETKAL